jgi:hypothetical protein
VGVEHRGVRFITAAMCEVSIGKAALDTLGHSS